MKKIVALASLVTLLAPIISFAAAGVKTLNGLDAADQFLATSTGASTMHLRITETGLNTHNFIWDNTPWRVDQGGTGAQSFTAGQVIYGNGTSAFSATTGGLLGQVLQFNGSFPVWVSTSSLGITSATTPAGSNKEIQFNNGGVFGADTKFTFDSNSGILVVGTTSAIGPNDRWSFAAQTLAGITPAFSINEFGIPGASLNLRSARGTITSPQAVQSGDLIGRVVFSGHDGTSFTSGIGSPGVQSAAAENWTTTAHGAGLGFLTVATGTTVRTEKMTLSPDGNLSVSKNLSIGGNLSAVGSLNVGSGVNISNGSISLASTPFGNLWRVHIATPTTTDTPGANLVFDGLHANGNASGGGIELRAGFGGTFGGAVFLQGGRADNVDGVGGNITLSPGAGSGANGSVVIFSPNSGAQLTLDTSQLAPQSNPNTVIFPGPGTFGMLERNQAWTGQNTWSGQATFDQGSGATTTVTFGKIGDTSSHACFNTKNTDGENIHFYFVGTSMVVEASTCN